MWLAPRGPQQLSVRSGVSAESLTMKSTMGYLGKEHSEHRNSKCKGLRGKMGRTESRHG